MSGLTPLRVAATRSATRPVGPVYAPSFAAAAGLRAYATSTQSLRQPHAHKPLPEAETFDKTARPGLYYARPSPRDLPPLRVRSAFVLPLL